MNEANPVLPVFTPAQLKANLRLDSSSAEKRMNSLGVYTAIRWQQNAV